ncbi:MAG TPA: efflux RND transporter periplasmic adaptor subunit [Holophagaceae bacterium]|nr:efflux RND transporter periplasmic adaptor subunit [Holophagaceae bacterium]
MTTSTSRSFLKASALVALGLVLGLGGARLFRSGPGQAAASAATLYQCPMHPQILKEQPGDCPICGMKLVPTEQAATPGKQAEHRLLFYRNPMDPSVTSKVPMKDQMGMDYLPVYEDELSGDQPVAGLVPLQLDPEQQRLIGVKTVAVEDGPVDGSWRTTARVAVDETRVRKVNVKVEGFVERLFVDFTGKPVRRGQPLFSLYSPELVNAQREYLLAVKTSKDAGADGLAESARRRLQFWDVPAAALDKLERTGEVTRTLTFTSPVDGVVTSKQVVEGARLMAGDTPFEITDLSQVWVQADAYAQDLARVRVGDQATFRTDAVPDKAFQGRVAFVDPVMDPQTRTARIRVALANPKGELRPELFGELSLEGRARKGLRIPFDAVMDTGTTQVAFVDEGEGRFVPRELKLGTHNGDFVEVLSGLKADERVVVGANFLLDSESRKKAAIALRAQEASR